MAGTIGPAEMDAYLDYLRAEEKSRNTVAKYARDIRGFLLFLGEKQEITKEFLLVYKDKLCAAYEAVSVNSILAALNGFLRWLGLGGWRLKPLKIQSRVFCDRNRELTREEYARLLQTARNQDNERLYLLMQTLCATGIRVSELRFITVEAARRGRAEVRNKGKVRIAFLPGSLQKILSRYAREQSITAGCVFRTRSGRPLDRSNIWREMKKLCADAGVAPSKVFPHNLRHLFAWIFYGIDKDLARLADVLGHSDIRATRIYTVSSGREHERKINRLGLVLAT